MLIKILGWLWLIMGLVFLLKPEMMRNRFKKMGLKRLKKIAMWLSLFLGLLIVKATWGIPGLLAKIVMILGIVAIIKSIYLFKAKAADKMIQVILDKPVEFFRACAIGYIIVGAIILSV